MDCWSYIFTLFSNQYWRPFVYPSTVLPLLPLAKREVTCHGDEMATLVDEQRAIFNPDQAAAFDAVLESVTNNQGHHCDHDIKETHVTGVVCTSTQTTQLSGCQSGARRRPSAMALRCCQFRRAAPPRTGAALRRTYHT